MPSQLTTRLRVPASTITLIPPGSHRPQCLRHSWPSSSSRIYQLIGQSLFGVTNRNSVSIGDSNSHSPTSRALVEAIISHIPHLPHHSMRQHSALHTKDPSR
jgi:hypothetical protein